MDCCNLLVSFFIICIRVFILGLIVVFWVFMVLNWVMGMVMFCKIFGLWEGGKFIVWERVFCIW